MPLKMFFSFQIQRFVCCCDLTASSALNAMQPQLVFWDARVLDYVEKHRWCPKDASIIKHVNWAGHRTASCPSTASAHLAIPPEASLQAIVSDPLFYLPRLAGRPRTLLQSNSFWTRNAELGLHSWILAGLQTLNLSALQKDMNSRVVYLRGKQSWCLAADTNLVRLRSKHRTGLIAEWSGCKM
jgi:hypothetical protein